MHYFFNMKTLTIVSFLLVCVLVYCEAHSVQGLKLQDYDLEKDCDCGKNSLKCTYRDGKKFCTCKEFFKQNGTTCERCDCRRHTKDCGFVNGQMSCTCFDGYIQRDDICVDACSENKPCQYGGTCEEGDCLCKNGTGGRLCQYVEACDYEEKCGREENVLCKYDIDKEQAYCQCSDEKKIFLEDEKECRTQCKESKECNFYGECEQRQEGKFCRCKAGLSGNFCDVINACPELCGSGEDVSCEYDVEQEKAKCVCEGARKKFDPIEKKCRETCEYEHQCENGARCHTVGNDKFCRCKAGTSGEFCEVVNGCYRCGDDANVTCRYNVTMEETTCLCRDAGKQFDAVMKKCRVPCTSSTECSNKAFCLYGESFSDDEQLNNYPFCRCWEGTSGDRCEVVDDCMPEKEYCGDRDDVTCGYDAYNQRAECWCKDETKSFDAMDGICKVCTCGPKTYTCGFDMGKKVCSCYGHYVQREAGVCEECGCGDYITGCSYDAAKGTKCLCRHGFSQNGTICEECDCGPHGYECEFTGGRKVCSCKRDYVQKDGICVRGCDPDSYLQTCQNGGICNETTSLCECKEGTKGLFCNEITDCKRGEICGTTPDVLCRYDEENAEGYCKCKENIHAFDETDLRCKDCVCGGEGNCSFVDGEKVCTCEKNYILKDGNCVECDCGNFGTCFFNGDVKVCDCDAGYSAYEGKCHECSIDGECGTNGTCKFDQAGMKFCSCASGYELKNGKCEECDCGIKGTCTFNSVGGKLCTCKGKAALHNEKCVEQCSGKCSNGGSCVKKDGKQFCSCHPGTSGDLCDVIDECSTTFTSCKDDNGECKYDVKLQRAYCECKNNETMYDESMNMCRKNCSVDEDQCKYGALCNNSFCQCQPGTTGDFCTIVDACKTLQSTCIKTNAQCMYDPENADKATCACTDEDYVYDQEKKECIAKWCMEKQCYGTSTCEYDSETKTGYCKCKNRRRYYDYVEKSCKPIDACVTKHCGENQVCIEGSCTCLEGYTMKEGQCERTSICNNDYCFSGSICHESGIPGIVKCECSRWKFYNGKFCKHNDCILPESWSKCGLNCPDGMKRNNEGDCEVIEADRKCLKKDCGFGWCIKEGNQEVCKCVDDYTILQNGTCILDADEVCASKQLNSDLTKCQCSGIYKYDRNGITCEKRSCADEDVQTLCQRAGAVTCKDDWQLHGYGTQKGFECVCGPGYEKDSYGVCREKCSLDIYASKCSDGDQMCYLDEDMNPNCVCPPMFSWNNDKKTCMHNEENTLILSNIPIVKTKYLQKDGSIDKMLLNSDIIVSVKHMFSPGVLNYVYPTACNPSNRVVKCDVIIQLNRSADSEIQRLKHQVLNITQCRDSEPKATIFPPNLLLNTNDVQEVTVEKGAICSDTVKEFLCGADAICDDEKCSCRSGFEAIASSVKEIQDTRILKCRDRCQPNPCYKGKCQVKDDELYCSCENGYVGKLCDHEDPNIKKKRNIKIVIGVIGGLFGATAIVFAVLVVRKRRQRVNAGNSSTERISSPETS